MNYTFIRIYKSDYSILYGNESLHLFEFKQDIDYACTHT
jgi:hypothetical protein